MPDTMDAAYFNARGKGALPGHIGLRITAVQPTEICSELTVEAIHMAPNGFLHAGTLVTLADTSCGYGCIVNLPEGAAGFTTIELKSNHLGTTRDGLIKCVAKLVHAGRTTQVWDAIVKHHESGKTLALFRCTQMVLYPK